MQNSLQRHYLQLEYGMGGSGSEGVEEGGGGYLALTAEPQLIVGASWGCDELPHCRQLLQVEPLIALHNRP